jgi:hypothetical protein
MERKRVEEQLATPAEPVPARLQEFLELAGDAYLLSKSALPEEKRDFLKIVTSNRQASGKNVEITLAAPFDQVANRNKITYGAPYRDVPRTLDALLDNLTAWFKANPAASFEAALTLSDKDTGDEIDIKRGELAA